MSEHEQSAFLTSMEAAAFLQLNPHILEAMRSRDLDRVGSPYALQRYRPGLHQARRPHLLQFSGRCRLVEGSASPVYGREGDVTGGYLVGAAIAAGALSATIATTPPVLLIWNTTASMPPGLYRVVRAEPTRGQVVVTRLPPSVETRAVALGFLRAGTPVVRRIAAVAGDVVCRFGAVVTINGRLVAIARRADRHTPNSPLWQGCRRLASSEVFLLGHHPRSFDGRYFGPIDLRLYLGVAHPLLSRTNLY